MKLLRAWSALVMLSFTRLLWSSNTLMVMLPLAGCALFLIRRRYDYPEIDRSFNAFSTEFIVFLFTSFVVPICALAYATTSIGGDREDRTLLFLLVRPIPRPLVLLAKLVATLPLVLGLVIGSYWLYCKLAGQVGEMAFSLYLSPVFFMTLAYVALFHLFAVAFRHSTIVALIYSLFMEFFLGNMPGLIKRIAVNFYARSMMYDLGAEHGMSMPDPQWFVPVSAPAGAQALLGLAVGGLLLAMWIFSRKEYLDLT